MKESKKFLIRPELLELRAEVISALAAVDIHWPVHFKIDVEHRDNFLELSEFGDRDVCKLAVSTLRQKFRFGLDVIMRHDGWCILVWPRGVGYRVCVEGGHCGVALLKQATDAEIFAAMEKVERDDPAPGAPDGDPGGDPDGSPEGSSGGTPLQVDPPADGGKVPLPDLEALLAQMPWLRGRCDHRRGCIVVVTHSRAELYGLLIAIQAHWHSGVKILAGILPGLGCTVELWPGRSGWQVYHGGRLLPFLTPLPSIFEIEDALDGPSPEPPGPATDAARAAVEGALQEVSMALDQPPGSPDGSPDGSRDGDPNGSLKGDDNGVASDTAADLDVARHVPPAREMDAALYARAVRRVLLGAPVVLCVMLESNGAWEGNVKLEIAASALGIDRRGMRRLCNYLQPRRWLIDDLANLVIRENIDAFMKFTIGEPWDKQYEQAVGLLRHRNWGLAHYWTPPPDRIVLIGHVSALSTAINERLLEECEEAPQ